MADSIGNPPGLNITAANTSVENASNVGKANTTIKSSENVNGRKVAEATHQVEVHEQRDTNQASSNKCWQILCTIGNAIKDAFHAFEDRAENSRLFEGFKEFSKGMAELKNAPDIVKSDRAVAEKYLAECEQKNIFDPSHKKFSGGASAALLMQYPNKNGSVTFDFVMQELAKDSMLAKCLSAKTSQEFCSENIEFLDQVQQLFIKDVNAPEMFDSDNIEYKVDDLESVFNELVFTGSPKEINLSSSDRKSFCKAYHKYVDALKKLDTAQQQHNDLVAMQDLSSVPSSIQQVIAPDIFNGTAQRLDGLDTEIHENDPLTQEKQTVLDAKTDLDKRLMTASGSIGLLLMEVNSHLISDLNRNIEESPKAQKVISHHFAQQDNDANDVNDTSDMNETSDAQSSSQPDLSLANFTVPLSQENNTASNNVSADSLQPIAALNPAKQQNENSSGQIRV